MSSPASNEYRLDLGGTVLALHCPTDRLAAGMVHWFGRPSTAAEAHIELDLEVAAERHGPELPTSLLTTKTLGPDGSFDVAGGLITGRFDRTARRGLIRARQLLFEVPLVRVLEQIFYQAFFSALPFSGRDTRLIHSSAVIAAGGGYLFVGPSEAGKSTAAECSRAHQVIGDEMNALDWTAEGLFVEGTGFNGLFRDKAPGRAPLKAVFLLKKTPEHALSDVSPVDAVTALAAEIVPPVGLDEIPDADTLPAMVDSASRILQSVPVRTLEFRQDPGFWPLILAAYGPDTVD